MLYDQKCYDLAEKFLADDSEINTECNRSLLAQEIQRTIEDYIADLKEKP